MKKAIFSFLLLLLSLTACNARSEAPDAQQAAQPQAETALPVDVSTLPEGQCYRQTPYLNPIGISQPDGQCVWNGKVYSFSLHQGENTITDAFPLKAGVHELTLQCADANVVTVSILFQEAKL